MVNSLDKTNSPYSGIFAEKIKARVLQRRTVLSDIICFLSGMSKRINTKFNFYREPSNDQIKTFIKQSIKLIEVEPANESIPDCQNLTLEELLLAVKQPSSPIKKTVDSIDSELSEFRSRELLGPILTETLEILTTIRPTSVESERVFSSCSRIITKFRSSIKGDLLSAIIILKKLFIRFLK